MHIILMQQDDVDADDIDDVLVVGVRKEQRQRQQQRPGDKPRHDRVHRPEPGCANAAGQTLLNAFCGICSHNLARAVRTIIYAGGHLLCGGRRQ